MSFRNASQLCENDHGIRVFVTVAPNGLHRLIVWQIYADACGSWSYDPSTPATCDLG